MKEIFLLDICEYEQAEDQKWQILDEIDQEYKGDIDSFVEDVVKRRKYGNSKWILDG